jgi:hypothetical protein
MQQQQLIDIINQPHQIKAAHLADLEILIKEYPFFETAHLLYTKGLHQHQAINYSKQLRKTAIIANSRSVLYELLHKIEVKPTITEEVNQQKEPIEEANSIIPTEESPKTTGAISITNNDIKVIYVNTVSNSVANNTVSPEKEVIEKETLNSELNIIKEIENETEVPSSEFDIDKLNKTIEQEINKEIIQSYVQTDIIKTHELAKEDKKEPSSFTDWLKTIQKESHTFQIDTKSEIHKVEKNTKNTPEKTENDIKSTVFDQKKQLIDKIIESDPGRIKLGTNKFFSPATDAKQSLLENEHLVTETLAKIYALQGNISKAIRAYEILSLKFPQKSVYFASLIEKLKTNK